MNSLQSRALNGQGVRPLAVGVCALAWVIGVLACEPSQETKEASEAPRPRVVPMLIDWSCFGSGGISYDPPSHMDAPIVARIDNEGKLVDSVETTLGSVRKKPPFTRLEMIRGYPCLIANSGLAPSNLDAIVSLNIRNVSPWNAIKTVLRQIHCELLYGAAMYIHILPTPGIVPPPEFYRSQDISLNLKNATAREALCAILAQSGVEMGITYRAVYKPVLGMEEGRSSFEIRFFENGRQMFLPGREGPSDMPNWTVECQEAQQPAEDCGEREDSAPAPAVE